MVEEENVEVEMETEGVLDFLDHLARDEDSTRCITVMINA